MRNYRYWLAAVMVLGLTLLNACASRECSIPGPPSARVGPVIDTLHGTLVPDPYRWLEDDSLVATRNWKLAQKAYCDTILGTYPKKARIRERLDELLQIGWVDVPKARGDLTFFEKREGTQDHGILYVRKNGGEPRVVIDPNTLSVDGSVAMSWYYPSEDGKLLAYGLTRGGTERGTTYIMDVATGKTLADSIPDCRYPYVSWLKDASGFYYTKLPSASSVKKKGDEAYFRRVYFHKLGTDPTSDPLVFKKYLPKTNWPGAALTDDNEWLIVFNSAGFSKDQVYALHRGTGTWITIADTVDYRANFSFELSGRTVYMLTDQDAPHFRIVAVDLDEARRTGKSTWTDVIREDTTATISDFTVAKDRILVHRVRNVISEVTAYDLTGKKIAAVELPIGSVHRMAGRADNPNVYIGFSSFFIPPTVYKYDAITGDLSVFDAIKTDIDVSRFEQKQVWYKSKDGTRVPMFLAYLKGTKLDGSNPTLLYGYGGFGSIMKPYFARNRFLWMENGGVYAQACIRGGGEFGEDWHKAGMFGNKQNSFDDFIAAGEWLVQEGYTSSDKLVIKGGSNGGLLVAAVTMQRPELFRVVVASAGVHDMLRFHLWHFGRFHTTEYGNPEIEKNFRYLLAYSPYHNVKPGTRYPAMLFAASDTDTRVHHAHSMKIVARLQAANRSCNPAVLRLETDIGHGWGASRTRIVDELTDEWTFVFQELGMSPR
jgi:prolyl oligopeptidase